MTLVPTLITIDERMKRGLCSPLQGGPGVWYHAITGTDVLETVYDPRQYEKTSPYAVRRKKTPGVGYFSPGSPLPQPTGRCQDLIDMAAGDDPRNWKLVRMEDGWGDFKWIGPRLSTVTPIGMSVPRERMHEMAGARGMGDVSSNTVGFGLVTVGFAAVGLWMWWRR